MGMGNMGMKWWPCPPCWEVWVTMITMSPSDETWHTWLLHHAVLPRDVNCINAFRYLLISFYTWVHVFVCDSSSIFNIGKTLKNSDLLECLVAWFAVSKDSPAMTGALGALGSRRNWLELTQRSMKLTQRSGFMAEAVDPILVLRDFISFWYVFWHFQLFNLVWKIQNSSLPMKPQPSAIFLSAGIRSLEPKSHIVATCEDKKRPIQNPSGVCGMEWQWCCCTLDISGYFY